MGARAAAGAERRRHGRTAARRRLLFSPRDGSAPLCSGIVEDMSLSGLGMRSRGAPGPGTVLDLEIDHLPGDPLLLPGHVVYARPEAGGACHLGIAFDQHLSVRREPVLSPPSPPPKPEPVTDVIRTQPTPAALAGPERRRDRAGLVLLLLLALLFAALVTRLDFGRPKATLAYAGQPDELPAALPALAPADAAAWQDLDEPEKAIAAEAAKPSRPADTAHPPEQAPEMPRLPAIPDEDKPDTAGRQYIDPPSRSFFGESEEALMQTPEAPPADLADAATPLVNRMRGAEPPPPLAALTPPGPAAPPEEAAVAPYDAEGVPEPNGDAMTLASLVQPGALEAADFAEMTSDSAPMTGQETAAASEAFAAVTPVEADLWVGIYKGRHELVVYRGDTEMRRFPVGLGVENATPDGRFRILNKLVDPDWYDHGRVVPAGDPENPLGRRWLGLANENGPSPCGIHATTDTASIGRDASRGCIRMRPEDIETVFRLCPVGTPVLITL